MRLETLPLILGVLVGAVGVLLLWDAWAADDLIAEERRRRPRRERDRTGEALVGFGAIAMGAAFIGRDTWRYDTIAVIAGTLLLLIGAVRNRSYLKELFTRPARTRPVQPDENGPALVTPSQFADLPRRIR